MQLERQIIRDKMYYVTAATDKLFIADLGIVVKFTEKKLMQRSGLHESTLLFASLSMIYSSKIWGRNSRCL